MVCVWYFVYMLTWYPGDQKILDLLEQEWIADYSELPCGWWKSKPAASALNSWTISTVSLYKIWQLYSTAHLVFLFFCLLPFSLLSLPYFILFLCLSFLYFVCDVCMCIFGCINPFSHKWRTKVNVRYLPLLPSTLVFGARLVTESGTYCFGYTG